MKKRNKSYLYIIFLIIFLEVIPFTRRIINSSVIYVAGPVISSVSKAAYRSSGILSGITEISSIKKENSDLVQKLKQIQVDRTELEELKHENSVLKNQLGFLEQHQDMDLIPARIISKEPFGAVDKIVIDKGSKDNVRENTAVVSNGSLIGKVTQVFDQQSRITLISSKNSIVQAMLQDSRTLGIIKGSLDGAKMENIPQDVAVKEGETIVTSGLGGEIAPGILIGWAKGDYSSKSEIYKVLNIDLAEDLNKLEYVFVVK